jgi:hypothetical protein
MRSQIKDDILFIAAADLPAYKKTGSVVRNTYFWALKAIAAYTPYEKDWEFDPEVWIALKRMLLAFTESGYLGLRETTLEFPADTEIPDCLRAVATWE